jgi:hypothetical protein
LTPEFWLGVGILGAYVFILGWNSLAAALSYMRRFRRERFPLGRCLLAAAGPSAVPVLLPVALAWWGRRGDGASLVVVLSLGLSFWASGAVERRLPPSVSKGDRSRGELLEFDFEEPFIYTKSG